MIKLMKRIKLLWLVVFWLFATTTALSAIITHDISTANLTISGTSTDDYVITGSTTANYVDIETGYQGTVTLKDCMIDLSWISHSCIKIYGQNDQSNLSPLTNVKIVLEGNNRLLHDGDGGSRGWAALQVDQGAQINISAINPHDNTSGRLEAIIGSQNGGAGIGALANNSTEARGSATLSCGGSGPTAGGNIVISSGTITAIGGHGAGIGGGFRTYYDGMIVIYGGVVESRAGRHAAGIGSGCPTGTGVINCYTPNSAIIVLPPAQITASGSDSAYGSQIPELALAGTNSITYIGDPEKPQVIVRTEDFEPNANIYVDLSMNSLVASIITAIVPPENLDINKVKFGQTDSSGIYSFNGILNDSTTFFTDASSSQPATFGCLYFPEKAVLPNGGTVILRLAMDLSLQVFPSNALCEGYSSAEAFDNAYKLRLIYKDNKDMTDVVFDLANGANSDFSPIRFFKTDATEITAPGKLIKGDTLDIVIPVKNNSLANTYSDVLRIIGKINGELTGYIRQVVGFTVHPTFKDTIYVQIYDNDSYFFGGKYYAKKVNHTEIIIHTDSLQTVWGCDSLSTLHLTVHPTFDARLIEVDDLCGDIYSFGIDFEKLHGIVDYYSFAFDAKALAAGFSDVTQAPFTNPIIVNLPPNIRPDYYSVNITLENKEKYKQEFTLKFTIRYPSSVIVQKWNDVVALYNSDYNGGYEYSAIQWYKNGNILYGENYSYLYLENSQFSAGDEYSALLTRTDDGESVFTCPLIVVVRALSTQVYPTILSAGETINIISPKKANVSIYNPLGVLSTNQNIDEGNNTINSLNTPGFYFMIVSDEEGVFHRQTIIVK